MVGNVRSADMGAVRRGVAQLRAVRRAVCTAYRVHTDSRTADPAVAVQFEFLTRLHDGDSIDLIWGGGGITATGWLHDDSLDALLRRALPVAPLDATDVGRIDSLPTRVGLTVERVALTPTQPLQLEQFHPRAGPITMETSSAIWLTACPGGWNGEPPTDKSSSWGKHWPNGNCISFRRGTPARLPDAWSNDFHLSVAVNTIQVAPNIDITLRYTAADPTSQCFIARVERLCQPSPEP